MSSAKRINPSAERNRDPILHVLKETIPQNKALNALEIASGSGTHVGYFAEHLPHVTWQPSDCDQSNLPSLHAYKQEHPNNILDPLVLDVSEELDLKNTNYDFILCTNMIHISPWAASLGLLANAGHILQPEGTFKIFQIVWYKLCTSRTTHNLWTLQSGWCIGARKQ